MKTEEKTMWCARLIWSSGYKPDTQRHYEQECVWERGEFEMPNDAWLAAGYTGSGAASPLFEGETRQSVLRQLKDHKEFIYSLIK